ncbi:polycystin-2-like protein 2 [Discoglossus pictus]
MHRNKGENARVMRWFLSLQPFSFDLIHRAGTRQGNADALSRFHCLSEDAHSPVVELREGMLSFGMVTPQMYYLNNAMSNLFLETPFSDSDSKNYKSISSVDDFWKFAEGPLLDGLYWTTWYNNESMPEDRSFVYYENLLLGVPQIRQLKVRNNSCTVHSFFKDIIKECYQSYAFVYEDREDFGFRNASEWQYKKSHVMEWYIGDMGTYSSAGFKRNLSQTKVGSKEILEYLKTNNWITRGTRVVFIDFSLYNVNINLFFVARLVVEFPATGGAKPSWKFYAEKLLRYISNTDYFFASCEIIFCLFICTFLVHECIKVKKQKKEYFKCLWNWLDSSLIMVSFLAIAFNVYRTFYVATLLATLRKDPKIYPDFLFLAFWQSHYNNMIAITVFFAWIKIFKYITFNKTMSQMSKTLSRCAKDILGFAIMFLIIFSAYAQLAYLVFGAHVDQFSTFGDCVFTQLRIILGDFNFEDIERADRVLGPMYFITFVFFVFFVLLNMFLAIINDTYTQVKADFSGTTSEFKIWDIMKQPDKKLAR